MIYYSKKRFYYTVRQFSNKNSKNLFSVTKIRKISPVITSQSAMFVLNLFPNLLTIASSLLTLQITTVTIVWRGYVHLIV